MTDDGRSGAALFIMYATLISDGRRTEWRGSVYNVRYICKNLYISNNFDIWKHNEVKKTLFLLKANEDSKRRANMEKSTAGTKQKKFDDLTGSQA